MPNSKRDYFNKEYLESLPKSKAEARKLSKSEYFSESECSKGHISSRKTINCNCCVCLRENANMLRAKKTILKSNRNSSANRKRIDELKDTGEYKEVWEE